MQTIQARKWYYRILHIYLLDLRIIFSIFNNWGLSQNTFGRYCKFNGNKQRMGKGKGKDSDHAADKCLRFRLRHRDLIHLLIIRITSLSFPWNVRHGSIERSGAGRFSDWIHEAGPSTGNARALIHRELLCQRQ